MCELCEVQGRAFFMLMEDLIHRAKEIDVDDLRQHEHTVGDALNSVSKLVEKKTLERVVELGISYLEVASDMDNTDPFEGLKEGVKEA